jgi:hypothetical protein
MNHDPSVTVDFDVETATYLVTVGLPLVEVKDSHPAIRGGQSLPPGTVEMIVEEIALASRADGD